MKHLFPLGIIALSFLFLILLFLFLAVVALIQSLKDSYLKPWGLPFSNRFSHPTGAWVGSELTTV